MLDGARPVFGPAARPLPQLPLGVDDDGYLVADGRLLRPRRAAASGTATGDRPADGDPRRTPLTPRRLARWLDDRLGAAGFARKRARQGLPRPLVVHDRRDRPVVLRRSWSLTGIYLTFFFDPSDAEIVYHGSYGRCGAWRCPRPTSRPST